MSQAGQRAAKCHTRCPATCGQWDGSSPDDFVICDLAVRIYGHGLGLWTRRQSARHPFRGRDQRDRRCKPQIVGGKDSRFAMWQDPNGYATLRCSSGSRQSASGVKTYKWCPATAASTRLDGYNLAWSCHIRSQTERLRNESAFWALLRASLSLKQSRSNRIRNRPQNSTTGRAVTS